MILKALILNYLQKNRIRGAILDEVRKLSPLPRSAISTVREHSEATQRLTSELGRQPTNAEMADHLGKDIESFEKDRPMRIGFKPNLSTLSQQKL